MEAPRDVSLLGSNERDCSNSQEFLFTIEPLASNKTSYVVEEKLNLS
jgi:hypothetical protein